MQTIRVAVIEDDPSDLKLLSDCLEQYSAEYKTPLEITAFPSGEAFLASGTGFQIIFMDIEMPGRNGIETAAQLRKKGQEDVIVLVTNMVQYAIHGYAVKAADYIVKPVGYRQIELKMPEYIAMIRRRQKDILVKNRQGMTRVRIREIRYIEIYGHNIMIHMTDRTEECYGTLKNMEEELHGYGVIKCSQSCLVNLAFVDGILQDTILSGSDQIPMSRRERKNFLEAFTKFDGGYGL